MIIEALFGGLAYINSGQMSFYAFRYRQPTEEGKALTLVGCAVLYSIMVFRRCNDQH